MSDSFAGFGGGGWDSLFSQASGAYGTGANPNASDWSKLLSGLTSKEGSQALGGLGKSLLGASSGSDDWHYLRTAAGTAPWSPGTSNSLLSTLIQMRAQEQQQQQHPLGQNFRSSLLG